MAKNLIVKTILAAMIWAGLQLETGLAEDHSSKGLIVFYRFDENSGAVTADKSGKGNNGAIEGATWTKGKPGSALKFNGKDSYVDCGPLAGLNDIKALTIEMWVYRERSGINQYLFYQNYDGLGLSDPSGKGQYMLMSNYTGKWLPAVQSDEAAPMNEWTHLAITWDLESGEAIIYYDGVKKGSAKNEKAKAIAGDLVVLGAIKMTAPGSREATFEYPFEGSLDEFAIYNRVLSQEEIEKHVSGN
ncbi:MAG: LamG domain-containing protein [Verrucomicrobia bacterium]|nr:LamG domain-containing protein [Verrucomicrobiota bacterium]